MAKNNNSTQDLINDLKKVNQEAKDYLNMLNKKIADLDTKYVGQSVQHNISMLRAAKSVLKEF